MIIILYDLLFLIPLSASVAALFMPRLYPDVSPAWLAVVFASSVYAALAHRLKARGRMVLAGVSVSAVLGLILAVLRFDLTESLTGKMWIAAVIAAVCASFVFLVLTDDYPLVRALLSAGGLIFLIASPFAKIPVSKTAVVSLVMFIIVCAADLLQKTGRKDGDTDPAKHLVFTAPFVLIVLIAISLLKTPDKPYDWGVCKKCCNVCFKLYRKDK